MNESIEVRNLTIERAASTRIVTINRPKALNALNARTISELAAVFSEIEADESARSVIITGSGEKSFIAGADIKELAELDARSAWDLSRRGQALFSAIEAFPKPVIAAVNGFCLGGGCELALACHVRIASKQARFGQPEVKLGIIPGYGGTQRLRTVVGRGQATEMILSGGIVPAEQALSIGLVNRVVEQEELLAVCLDLAAQIDANAPLAVRYSLLALHQGADMPLSQGLDFEASLFGLSCATADMKEGTAAFIEKRKPEFQGS